MNILILSKTHISSKKYVKKNKIIRVHQLNGLGKELIMVGRLCYLKYIKIINSKKKKEISFCIFPCLKQIFMKILNNFIWKIKQQKKTISFRLTKQQHFEYIFIYVIYIYNVRVLLFILDWNWKLFLFKL